MSTEQGIIEARDAIVIVEPKAEKNLAVRLVVLPLIFLTVTMLGGLRFGEKESAFIFLVPPLLCLVFAAAVMVLFFRSGLLRLDGWLSETRSTLENVANAAILVTLFTATVQIFNSLMPEQGLPFWVIGFCFVWTLWNNLFSDFDAPKLMKSLAAMFALAFVAKYLILANLVGPSEGNWLQRMIENPGKETFTWLLDLPRYAAATGYVQFFAAVLYLGGLYLTPSDMDE